MKYNGTIYRPPVEAGTFLIPVTEGCSHNRCVFCTYFKDQPFRKATIEEIEADTRVLVRCLTNDTIFMNEHASNTFHVQCRLPEAKDELLEYIEGLMEQRNEAELRRYREMVTRAF